MVTRLTLALACVALGACREDVTGDLRFTCALDRECLPGWYCGAQSICERAGAAGADVTDAAETSDADTADAPDTIDAGETTDAPDTIGDAPDTTDTTATTDTTDAPDTVDAADVSDVVADVACAPYTHVLGKPVALESELVIVRDLAFASDGAVVVSSGLGLVGALATSSALVPVDGLDGSAFGYGHVVALGDGSWVATRFGDAIAQRFRLTEGDGVLIATDLEPVDLGRTMIVGLLAPPNAWLVVADLTGLVWLVEPDGRAGHTLEPVFGDLLEPTHLAFDPERGNVFVGHGARARVTMFDASGARSELGVAGAFPPPAVRSCDGLAAGDPCLGPTGSQGACSPDAPSFCVEAPNVTDPRLPACPAGAGGDCAVRVSGELFEGFCDSQPVGGPSFCWLREIDHSEVGVCIDRQRGDPCVFLGEPRLGTPPPFDREDDADQDGIPDDIELEVGLDPFDHDWDDDGHWDGYEPFWGLDLDGDGDIAAKDLDSDGDGWRDAWDHEAAIPRYGTCLTAGEVGVDYLGPDLLLCVDPTDPAKVDPFDRPMLDGLAVLPCGDVVFTTLQPGTGEALVHLGPLGGAVTPLTSSGLLTAVERGAGGRFPATSLYAFDREAERLVELTFCVGPCPAPQ